ARRRPGSARDDRPGSVRRKKRQPKSAEVRHNRVQVVEIGGVTFSIASTRRQQIDQITRYDLGPRSRQMPQQGDAHGMALHACISGIEPFVVDQMIQLIDSEDKRVGPKGMVARVDIYMPSGLLRAPVGMRV